MLLLMKTMMVVLDHYPFYEFKPSKSSNEQETDDEAIKALPKSRLDEDHNQNENA